MTRSELNQLQAMLSAKHHELSRSSGRREGITIERAADLLDQLQLANDRELTTRTLEHRSGLLRSVREALDRVADGSYGTCADCEDEISPRRLRALPWASLCLSCQERADRSLPKAA